jgi:hypothetical protein
VFIILDAPFPFYDSVYGKMYRGVCNFYFGEFHKTGFVRFKPARNLAETHLEIGNTANVRPDGTIHLANADFNTRYRGYIPTVFFISLLVASPISRRRKVFSFFLGISLLMVFLMLKQWIHLLYVCEQAPWLELYTFTADEQKNLDFIYFNFVNYGGSALIVVIAIWILVCFRKSDFELFYK